MAERIIFSGKQVVVPEAFQLNSPSKGMVRVKGLYSLMSTGTESIVLNRLFEPNSHWDKWVKYPFHPGYAFIGQVEELGPQVETLHLGDYVAIRTPHASECVVPADSCYPVPSGVDLKTASWFALAKIGFMGARVAQYSLGDSVLIIGAGPIGQMSVRWAAAAGAQIIIVVDSLEQRLEMAKQGGATHVLARPIEAVPDEVKAILGGEGPHIVIDATGVASVFAAALGIVRSYGRVVILGDTGTPTGQHLTGDVISRGLTIIGAHDSHNDKEWNNASITHLFFELVQTNRFNLTGLNTHEFAGTDCQKAYEVANRHRADTMGILFNWNGKNIGNN